MGVTQKKTGTRINFFKGGLVLIIGIMVIAWLLLTPLGILGKADAVAYAVCHRIDLRSFHIGARQMPLCARCSGMYLGAMLGLGYLASLGRQQAGMPPRRIWIPAAILIIIFAIDSINSYLYLILEKPIIYTPLNWLRLLTGSGMGLVIAGAVYLVFNQTVWASNHDAFSPLGLGSLLALILLALGVDGLVLSEAPLVLFPLAIISALGVVVLLTLIYTVIWITLLHREHRYNKFSGLFFPLTIGFLTALAQIALIDFVRYILTGTWQGFLLG